MKRALILCGALLATTLGVPFAPTADAQGYRERYYEGRRWEHPRPYGWCREKARRLHEYEYRASRDGRLSTNEKITIGLLRSDLQNSCGGGRWHPRRGWHYPG
jgi:hypothetical protein